MLQLTIPDLEVFDEKTYKIIRIKGQTIQLEHSLVSISKWEQKWKKPFLNTEAKDMTHEMSIDYVRCMTSTKNVNPDIYNYLSSENMDAVQAYIQDPMTATWFRKTNGPAGNRKIITNEVIYGWMIMLGIPFDPCQKWHLNRLMTLIKVCDENNAPNKKKMSRRQAAAQYRDINAMRRARSGSRG